MSFASSITRAPIAFDPQQAADLADRFAGMPPELHELLTGTAGCSPYLKSLMEKEADWLEAALHGDPDDVMPTLLADIRALQGEALKPGLRIAKRRMALFVALADLGGVWPLERVTRALTDCADTSVDACLRHLVAQEVARGKLPGVTQDDIARAGGMVALSMGKGGAYELNYSSDIDLICLYDDSRFDRDDLYDARASFIRVTRRMAGLMSDLTGEGYVFRTDLRLRPDASVTPVCVAMEAAERYYESVGRTWERAAHIKARPSAGDLDAGEAYLTRLAPFIWRKHLDFAAIEDAHDMRLRIRDHKRLHGKPVLDGHNLKLGRGGIREIEFFTQTRQIIAGGRDPDLRVRGTVDGLARLAEKNWVPEDVAEQLTADYRAHREVEHRLQMINDAQTHDLPNNDEGFDRLARFMGQGDTDQFRAELTERLDRVAELAEGFFAPPGSGTKPVSDLPDAIRQTTARWRTYPALRSPRAVEIFDRLEPDLLRRLMAAGRPEEAVASFDGFLSGLPAGVQLFSLFQSNPQLVDLIVDIAAVSPSLAQYLSRHSSVLDAVIGGDFFAPWPGVAALQDDLTARLAALDDYEAQLDTARRWAKEWRFRVGVHLLRDLLAPSDAAGQYADLAQAVVGAVWPAVVAQFATKHGNPPGHGAVVLGMGSLGAGQLSAGSDLDLIVIYDPAGVEASEGKRPLATRAYYARLTQALVTALSAPMAEGKLYEVDMRLRPSGNQGPVATSLDAFRLYQRDEAWTWEHLALTRARAVAGDPDLAQGIEAFRQDLLTEKGDLQKVLNGVADMRARLAQAKPARDVWDGKIGPGRAQDIELFAQAAALIAATPAHGVAEQLQAGVAQGLLNAEQADTLTESYHLFRRLQVAVRLISDSPLKIDQIGEAGLEFLLRATAHDNAETLQQALQDRAKAASDIIDTVLAPYAGTATEGDQA